MKNKAKPEPVQDENEWFLGSKVQEIMLAIEDKIEILLSGREGNKSANRQKKVTARGKVIHI